MNQSVKFHYYFIIFYKNIKVDNYQQNKNPCVFPNRSGLTRAPSATTL